MPIALLEEWLLGLDPINSERPEAPYLRRRPLSAAMLALKGIAALEIKTSNAVIMQIWCWCTTWDNAAADILKHWEGVQEVARLWSCSGPY